MKTLILSAASLLLVVFSASAQKKVNKEERKEKKEAIKASLESFTQGNHAILDPFTQGD